MYVQVKSITLFSILFNDACRSLGFSASQTERQTYILLAERKSSQTYFTYD